MKLTVLTPLGIVLEEKIVKVTMETLNGYHTLLPKHVDFVSALGPGIVIYQDEQNREKYVACHNGIVVKKGAQVTISVQNALKDDKLDELEKSVMAFYKQNEEQRKELNTAMARLEMGIMRGFERLREET